MMKKNLFKIVNLFKIAYMAAFLTLLSNRAIALIDITFLLGSNFLDP